MSEFEDKITKLNEEETFQSLMTYEEDQKKILNTEKKISFEEGEKKKQIEIAKNLLSLGVEKENILKATGLTLKQLEELDNDEN